MYLSKKERKELNRLKAEAHDLCDIIWGDMNSAFGNAAAQYKWLGWNTRTGHIATLTKLELERLIKTLRKMANKSGTRNLQTWWK
jgi:hypothetical protein